MAGPDTATVDDTSGHPVLVASDPVTATNAANRDYAQPVFAALDGPFDEASVGFAGSESDGLEQLDDSRTLTPIHPDAREGNVVGTARLALDGSGKTVLALGFGATDDEAIDTAAGSRAAGFDDGLQCLQVRLERLRRDADESARREAGRQRCPAEAAEGRLLPERQRDQGLGGQDVSGCHRGQSRLAVGPGGVGRRPEQHLLRVLSRGVRARPLRVLDRPRRGRRPRHGPRRDALPVRAPAAARRLVPAEQPGQWQGRARLVRDAARRGGLPDPDGLPARADRRLALRGPHQARRELRGRPRAGLRRRTLGGAERLLAIDDRFRDRRPRRGCRAGDGERRRRLRSGLAGRGRRDAALGQGMDGDDERTAVGRAVLHPAVEDRRSERRRSTTTSATAARRSTSAR